MRSLLALLALAAGCRAPDGEQDTGEPVGETGDLHDTDTVDTGDTGGPDTGDTGGGDTSDTGGGDTGDTGGPDTGGDTGDTGGGDTGDTGGGDTGDTGGPDTGDTGGGDTGDTGDTADTDETGDTADTGSEDTDETGDTADTAVVVDLDGDGSPADEDCDDADATVSPASAESRDLRDEDCDGLVDEDFVAVGDIVVTEVTRQPYTGGSGSSLNADAQWFEVHNTSAWDVDLTGWYLEEQDGDSFRVSADAALVVPAGGYAVFCYADTWFATPGTCAYEWGDSGLGAGHYDTTFYLDRDEDLVALYLDGALMDQVYWELAADDDGDTWPRTARYSMGLDPTMADPASNDDAGAWCLASSAEVWSGSGYTGYPDYGTPGAENGSCW